MSSDRVVEALSIVLSFVFLVGLSWAVTSFLTWLVFLCFGFEFTFIKATGVWILLVVASIWFKAVAS